MTDPASLDAFNDLFKANTVIDGSGLQTSISVPCPFCAAPNFMRYLIMETKEALMQGATCAACGRSGHFEFTIDTPTQKQFHLVQTGGPPAPDYLPHIKREPS